MLFALYVSGLGDALHNSKLGFQMGEVVLMAIFFADDLVLIAWSPKHAMDRLLEIVARFCRDMYMKLAVLKTFILTNKKIQSLGLTQYKLRALKRGMAQAVLRSYLGGDGADKMQLLECGKRMAIILEAWLVKVHELLRKVICFFSNGKIRQIVSIIKDELDN